MAIKLINPNSKLLPDRKPLVIGYFGCIHVMHQQLLTNFDQFNVLTFTNLMSKKEHQIYNYNLRIENLLKFNPANIYVLDINNHNMTGKEFIDSILMPLNPSAIVVGTDFRFGSDNKPVSELEKYFKVIKHARNEQVSTAKIRKLLEEGKIQEANDLLAFPIYYRGRWVPGKKTGRTIGYPTINIENVRPFMLKEGSYISKTYIGKQSFMSVSFVGDSLTFNKGQTFIETHIIDKKILPRLLYPKQIRNGIKVEFFDFLRPNTKFENIDQLKQSIKQDIEATKKYFADNV